MISQDGSPLHASTIVLTALGQKLLLQVANTAPIFRPPSHINIVTSIGSIRFLFFLHLYMTSKLFFVFAPQSLPSAIMAPTVTEHVVFPEQLPLMAAEASMPQVGSDDPINGWQPTSPNHAYNTCIDSSSLQ